MTVMWADRCRMITEWNFFLDNYVTIPTRMHRLLPCSDSTSNLLNHKFSSLNNFNYTDANPNHTASILLLNFDFVFAGIRNIIQSECRPFFSAFLVLLLLFFLLCFLCIAPCGYTLQLAIFSGLHGPLWTHRLAFLILPSKNKRKI